MRVYAHQLLVEGPESSAMASGLGLAVGFFPSTVEFGTRTFGNARRLLNMCGDLEAYRYTAVDGTQTLTIWND